VEYICGKDLVEDTGKKINYLERKRHIFFEKWMFRNGQQSKAIKLVFVASPLCTQH
jgi:hypothetical protein